MAKNTETAVDVKELTATDDIKVSLTKRETQYISTLLRINQKEEMHNLDGDFADLAKEYIELADSILTKIGY